MANSRNIAGTMGPAMVALSISEALNYRIWDTNMPQLIYLNGTLLLIAGIAIVRNHNLWVKDWRVLVTAMGWVAVFFGLLRMFFPEARQPEASPGMYAFLGLALLAGSFLSAKSYLTSSGNAEQRANP
jgi:uncharacterized membrane protein HdeD (DUF308 family)